MRPDQILSDALGDDGLFGMIRFQLLQRVGGSLRGGPQNAGQPDQRQRGHFGDVQSFKLHRQRFAPQPLAMAERAFGADQELGNPLSG